MTNNMIIFWESVRLMEEGKLDGTGEFVKVENANGEEVELEIPEAIHTFNGWKERGFVVRKGEKSDIRITIWKQGKGKKKVEDGEDEQPKSRLFMKTSAFFKRSQVEKLAEVAV